MGKKVLFVIFAFCFQSSYAMLYHLPKHNSFNKRHCLKKKASALKKKSFTKLKKNKKYRVKLYNLECKKSNLETKATLLNFTSFGSLVTMGQSNTINDCIELTSYDPRYFFGTTFLISFVALIKTTLNILTTNKEINNLKNDLLEKKAHKKRK